MQIRRAMMMQASKTSRLPAEYQEVEYIKSDGYAYINSGVYGNQDSVVELDFKIDVIADATMFGARTSATSNAFYILIRGGTWFASAYDGSGNDDFKINGTAIVADTNRHKITIDKRERYFDDVQSESIGTYTAFTTPKELYLFRSSHQANGTKMAEMRIYSCIINDNGTPVRNFVPCYRKQDNEIGMYDLINGSFYANGSDRGSFTKGQDI